MYSNRYLSAVKKLQLEQAKAKALIRKGAKQQHLKAVVQPAAAHAAPAKKPVVHAAPAKAAPKPALHAVPKVAKAAKAAAKGATAGPVSKGKLPLSNLYNTPLVGGYATVRHCAVDGGKGCGYPGDVDAFERGEPAKKVEKAVAECIPPKVLEDGASNLRPVVCQCQMQGGRRGWRRLREATGAHGDVC